MALLAVRVHHIQQRLFALACDWAEAPPGACAHARSESGRHAFRRRHRHVEVAEELRLRTRKLRPAVEAQDERAVTHSCALAMKFATLRVLHVGSQAETLRVLLTRKKFFTIRSVRRRARARGTPWRCSGASGVKNARTAAGLTSAKGDIAARIFLGGFHGAGASLFHRECGILLRAVQSTAYLLARRRGRGLSAQQRLARASSVGRPCAATRCD